MTRRVLLTVLVVLGFLAPVLFTVWVSFSPDSFLTPPTGEWSLRWYRAFAADRVWQAAVWQSLLVATASATVCVLAATPAAFAGRPWVSLLLLLPACLPPAALGVGLLPVFHPFGLWGTSLGLILVHATLGLPAAYLIVRSHLTESVVNLGAVANGLGASRWQAAWRVKLPLLRPALIAGWVAAFVLSLNESVVTLFLATPTNQTLAAVAWPQLRYSASPLVAVASVASAALGTLGLWLVLRLVRQK